MASDDPMIRFRPSDSLTAWLAQSADLARTGASPSMQAKADLGLLQMILDAELRRVRLTLAQAHCLADVMNGTITDATIGAGLGLAYAECYDAFRLAREDVPISDLSSYGAKWGPEDGDAAEWEQDLLDILGRLGPAADYALRRAIAAWWDLDDDSTEDAETDMDKARIARFASVGLRIAQ